MKFSLLHRPTCPRCRRRGIVVDLRRASNLWRLPLAFATLTSHLATGGVERQLDLEAVSEQPGTFTAQPRESGELTWWLPAGAQQFVLPISAGVMVDADADSQWEWLRQGSPWSLSELPALGLRYSDRMLVILVPWPHYAELVVQERVGIRFAFRQGRHQATPVEIVAMRRGTDPLEVARAFREWRRSTTASGALPRPRTLKQKQSDLPTVERLKGAAHFYLWGSALFSRHDVPRNQWIPFAKALQQSPAESVGSALLNHFSQDARQAVTELAQAEWSMDYLTITVAQAIDAALSDPNLLGATTNGAPADVVLRNKTALHEAFTTQLNPPATWGDGPSTTLLQEMREAGIHRGLFLLSDLYTHSTRTDLAVLANQLGYLLGPYDSYHSVHSPKAGANDTWETAQFDLNAYLQGRVIKEDGTGHAGFRGRGYHFSPQAAWPYVQERVGRLLERAPYSAWFVDCDATAECFDDFSPVHPATRVDDIEQRRRRLAWLEGNHQLVVGSEGGSALFADVIHFGHGVQTPYLGHLDPGFRDPSGMHFLGRHWPPDTPEQSFKPVPVPPALHTPYFDPTVRIPLYQAALGDEVIATHHWSFDTLKLEDVARVRALMEILYLVPPMYHLNRETWPTRRDRILEHLAFWGPLHRELAGTPLIRFEWLTADRRVQRTTFETSDGAVSITVNFSGQPRGELPPYAATVSGLPGMRGRVYRAAN